MKATRIAVSKPCGNCPFRSDVVPYLRVERVRDIVDAARRGNHFVCHKTLTTNDDGELVACRSTRACMGFLAFANHAGLIGGLTIAQLAHRLSGIDLAALSSHDWPVYRSVAELLDAHER